MNTNLTKVIFYLILVLLSIEYIRIFDIISVFQLFILPLCLVGILMNFKKISSKNLSFLALTIIVLLFTFITNSIRDFYTYFFFFAGAMLFISFLLIYFSKYTIDKRAIKILAIYSLPHVLFFILNAVSGGAISSFTGSASERFSGMHRDPNFMCVYINIAIVSKLTLYKVCNKKILKLAILSFIILDSIVIFYSLSRSGILILIISVLIYLWINNRKRLYQLGILMIPLILWIISFYNRLNYTQEMGLLSSILWRQKQTSSSGKVEDSRIDAIYNTLDLIGEGNIGIFGYPIDLYLNRYTYHPHNTFLDLILYNGLLIGGLLIVIIITFFYRSYKRMDNTYQSQWLFQICSTSFLSFTFLSMYQQKLFWLMLVVLFYASFRVRRFNKF